MPPDRRRLWYNWKICANTCATPLSYTIMNKDFELSLMDAEERRMVNYIWDLIPREDQVGMTQSDVLLVLDLVDDYLEEKGLLIYHGDEAEYLDGDIDEVDQLQYIIEGVKREGRKLSGLQVQLILDGELQYGIKQGYYEEIE